MARFYTQTLWTLALLSGGCEVFDAALLDDVDAQVEDGGETSPDARGPDAKVDQEDAEVANEAGGDANDASADTSTMPEANIPRVPVDSPADSCTDRDALPILTPPVLDFDVSTSGLTNAVDAPQGLQCTGGATPGNDAFFQIQVEAEEKWHFHITPKDEGSSPALYLLNSTCRASGCDARNGQDLCGPKQGSRVGDEHFTFVAQSAGTWYLGVDDAVANPDGWNYHLFAIRTSCGNGPETGGPEHGEACDPMGGPGSDPRCDTQCRNVLDPTLASVLTESPVNDDWTVADVLALDPSGADSLEVLGAIGQVCAYDMFAVNVAQGVSMEVSLTLSNGDPCPEALSVPCGAGAPCDCDADAGITECPVETQLRLELLGSDGVSVVGQGTVADAASNACPAIHAVDGFANDLSEGVYYLRLWAPEGSPRINYKLGVELLAP